MITVSPKQWQGMRARFLQRYPDFTDFSHPGEGFAAGELTCKRAILQRFEERGLRKSLPQMVAEGKGQEALRTLQRVNFSNLISSFHFWSTQFGRTDQQACTVLKGLLETAAMPYIGSETLVPLLDATKEAETKADWDVLKILWLFRPDDYFPVNISQLRKLAWHLGVVHFKLEGKQRLSTEAYLPLRDFVLGFDAQMSDWKPRDMTDVQSVLCDMAYHEIEEEGNTTDNGESETVRILGVGEGRVERHVVTVNWIMAAGPKACYWPDWYRDGYIAVGGEIGDSCTMGSKHTTLDALMKSGRDGLMNCVNAMYQFSQEMRLGDRVFVKDGRSRILGWGVITSACDHGTEDTFRWTVKWMSKEIRDIHPKYLPNPPLT